MNSATTAHCIHCYRIIHVRAKVCHVCGRSQRKWLRISQTSLALLVALASIMTFLLPELRLLFLPEESSISATYAHGNEDMQHVFVANDGKKPAILRSATLVFRGQESILEAPVRLEADPVLQPGSSTVYSFQRQHVSYGVGTGDITGEAAEWVEILEYEWEDMFPGFNANWDEDWCFIFRYAVSERAAFLHDRRTELDELEPPTDESVDHLSGYEKIRELLNWRYSRVDLVAESREWEFAASERETLEYFVDVAKLMPHLVACVAGTGVELRLVVLGSDGLDHTISAAVNYAQLHRFMLPIWMGNADFERQFVGYFLAPTDAVDLIISEVPSMTSR